MPRGVHLAASVSDEHRQRQRAKLYRGYKGAVGQRDGLQVRAERRLLEREDAEMVAHLPQRGRAAKPFACAAQLMCMRGCARARVCGCAGVRVCGCAGAGAGAGVRVRARRTAGSSSHSAR